jgi:phosphatidylinositol glycan class S
MASTNSPDAFSVDKDAATSSATPLAVVRSPKSPPPESSENIWLRRFAILSFWVVVVFLGLPIWLKTTAIYRAELPLQEMTAWAEGRVRPTFLNDV